MRSLFLITGIFITGLLSAQKYCGTTEYQNAWFAKHPELKDAYEKLKQEASTRDQEEFKNGYTSFSSAQKPSSTSNYTIPVVFHILHQGGNENISDAQVKDAVRILNEDYNKENTDTSNVVVQFKNLIGNVKFEFRLASKDPLGNCTNGIVRHWNANTNWSGNFSDYAYTWPAVRYLNVYVVRTIGFGAAGYTYLPGSGIPGVADAIVILSSYVGGIGTGNTGTSRALTHEVGHWFDLDHVWGGTNQPGVACGDDGVSDTPITKGYSSCTLGNSQICTPGMVENVQNYMEYAYCQRMFTIGQAARMTNAINSAISGRNNLSLPSNLAFTGITNPGSGCVLQMDLNANTYTVCTGRSVNLQSFVSNGPANSYLWTADNGAIVQNPTSATTSVLLNSVGKSNITCVATNSTGSVTQTIGVYGEQGLADIVSSNSESFETPGYVLPAKWKLISEGTSLQQWQIYPFAAASGGACIYAPGELLSANMVEILESPSYDFLNHPSAQFTFKYAYAKQNLNQKDVFKVQASKNCGGNWTDIYVPSTSQMAQGSGGVTSALYSLPKANEWKLYDLTQHPNFTFFKNEPNVKIRFYFEEDKDGIGYGNRLYLDDVNFSAPLGINELSRSVGLDLYPNPSGGEMKLEFTLSDASTVSCKVLNVTGVTVMSSSDYKFSEGTHHLILNENRSLSPGVYLLNFELNGLILSKKMVIE
ncbi:MAG: M43 family zinc metalloprotease [bacterium]|nr:M43 family zinc metalloprotease [bacterium]